MIHGHRQWLLSGGIGSGKSAVREMLAERGWRAIDADSVGHEVIGPDGPAFGAVARRWPATVVDGRIDRAALGRIVFGNQDALATLEDMTHPHILGAVRSRVQGIRGPVVVELPLLKPSWGEEWRRMVVDSGEEDRLERLLARGMSRADALARMASQPSRSLWLAAADLVIPNSGSLSRLEGTVAKIAP